MTTESKSKSSNYNNFYKELAYVMGSPESNLKDLISLILEEAVKITGSQIGYYHFLAEDKNYVNLFLWSK
ncbi:MAG: GAF domain-containing protein, partial [Leptospiraceae bacterium]|nr:GAF domain-containing protein [Leptospiraceae bacterium]